MSGRPGRSGGWNKLTPEQHILRGTFRPERHGGRTARAATAAQPIESVPPALVEGLTGPGKDFVTQAWQHYDGWTPPARVLLHQTGLLLDDAARLRGQPGERATQRLLLQTLDRLQLRD